MMEWANRYVGIHWLDRGRSWLGCDCYGLVRLVLAEQCHIELDAHEQFYRTVKGDRDMIASTITREKCLPGWRKLDADDVVQPFDVSLFVVGGLPIHCAVMISRELMLHVRAGADAVIESIRRPYWRSRREGVYRHV